MPPADVGAPPLVMAVAPPLVAPPELNDPPAPTEPPVVASPPGSVPEQPKGAVKAAPISHFLA
jgi:hypothetical protein